VVMLMVRDNINTRARLLASSSFSSIPNGDQLTDRNRGHPFLRATCGTFTFGMRMPQR
jgi:hypothetical protein